MNNTKNMPIKEVARELGKSQQYVRIGIQRGTLQFGIAEQLPNSTKYTYYISPIKFYEYIRKALPREYKENKDIITLENPIIDWRKINDI